MPATSYFDKRNALRARKIAGGFDPESVMIPGEGPMPCRVMFIGERPGKDEPWAEPPRPFVGLAGRELDRYLLIAGLRRDEVYITNLVKNYRDEDPEEWEIARDVGELAIEINKCQPEVIVPLGAWATKHFIGQDITMEMVSGIPHWKPEGIIFPILHPAAGLHSVDSMIPIVDAFENLRRLLRGDLPTVEDAFPAPDYKELNGRAVQFEDKVIAIDTEGWRERPWCLTYSSKPGTADLIPAENTIALGQFRNKLHQVQGKVLLHNSLHDLSVLGTLGVDLAEGSYIDTMILSYLLGNHPQGLKPLAYRLAGMEMDAYEDLVGPYNVQFALDYVSRLATRDWGPAEEWVLMETIGGQLVAKVKRPHGLNQRLNRIISDYNKSPDRVDIRERWNNINKDNPKLTEEARELCGEMPVADLSHIPREKAVHYANRDADATLRIFPRLMEEVVDLDLLGIMKIDHDILPMVDRMQRNGFKIDPKHFTDFLTPKMEGEMESIQGMIQVLTGAWINPDSGDQVAALLFDQLKLPWTKLTKSKKRPKCDDKVLESLSGAHPVVKLITDYRERSKIRSSFSIALVRFMDARTQRIHCNLRVTRVSSGRLAANSPNLLAIPVRSQLGLLVRQGFICDEGKSLSTHDLDQIEMREMAHQSGDETMVGIFNDGKIDIHRQTASFMFGCKPVDVSIIQRYAAKRVGFGVITGITGAGLVDQMAMAGAVGWTEDRCNEAIQEWFKMYPRVKTYMEDCRAEARRYGFVRDRFGRIRRLPAIYSSLKHVQEEAERQSHSFKISSSAQGIMKLGMKKVWDNVIKPMWKAGIHIEPLLQIHDEIIHEYEDGQWDYINHCIVESLTTADRIRVPIKAKGATGKNWGELEK